MIKYEILQIDIIRIVCQTVRRITNEILGVKGLNDQSLSINVNVVPRSTGNTNGETEN